MARNPFTPGFGVSPPVLAGRADIIAEFAEALEDGPGSPARATLYAGARGTGKTVMLNELGDQAAALGWLTIDETAHPGFIRRLVDEHLPRLLAGHDPDATATKVIGVSAPVLGGGIDWATAQRHNPVPGLREQLSRLCDLLAEEGVGLLLTLDEVALRTAAEATGGYPFLIQLVGHHVWRQHRDEPEITVVDVEAGIPAAMKRMGSLVHAEALKDLSHVDRTFLLAMAQDDGPSQTGQVAERLGVSPQYASVYRTRLLEARMIVATRYGHVDFALPYMRDYLRNHAAHIAHQELTGDIP